MSDGLPGSAAEPGSLGGSLTDRLDEYRRARGELERGVLPLATRWMGASSHSRRPCMSCWCRRVGTSSWKATVSHGLARF